MATEDPTPERWLPVLGFEGRYEVSDLGRIRTLRTRYPSLGKIMRSRLSKKGYPYIILRLIDRPGSKTIYVHRIVLEAFVGPRPSGLTCNHISGIKADCRLVNLEWVTLSANQLHKTRILGLGRGENHGNAKLTDDDVREIRAHPEITTVEFAKRLGVSNVLVGLIRRGLAWKHLLS